jgi:hypothetical protein
MKYHTIVSVLLFAKWLARHVAGDQWLNLLADARGDAGWYQN